MSGTENFEENEISLFELWEELRVGWRWLLGGVLLGVLGAVVVIFSTPNQYQAIATVQVGQVGQVEQLEPAGQVGQEGRVGQVKRGRVGSVPAEPSFLAVERMRSPAFQLSVAKELGDQRWMAALQNGGGASVLSVALPKGAVQLIELKVKSHSEDSAKKIVNAAINVLAKRHTEIAKPTVDRLVQEGDLAREKLRRAQSELEGLNKLATWAVVKDERFTQILLMTDLRVKKEAESFQQRQALSDLNGALAPPNTQPAHSIEDVFSSEKPVSPKKSLLLALGLVGGLLAGVVLVFISRAWRLARERRLLAESGKS